MKKLLVFCLPLFLLGCPARDTAMEEALALRGRLLGSDCGFQCTITVDYGDTLESFTLDCESKTDGTLTFTVTAPESISGITGHVASEGAALTFDDQVLALPLPQTGVSPLLAPWSLMQALRKGCITSVARTQEGVQLCVDDSYGDSALNLEIWTKDDVPQSAQISKDGRRIVSMEVEDFTFR